MSELALPQPKTVLVPDSIEPVIGWRCMCTMDGELIRSAQQMTPWLPKQPLEAQCKCGPSYWRWGVAYDQVPTTDEEAYAMVAQRQQAGGGGSNYYPAGVNYPVGVGINSGYMYATITTTSTYVPSSVPVPPRPKAVLAKGVYVLEWHTETNEAPNESHQCGIYLINAPDGRLASYAQHSQPGHIAIVAKTAGWGKVIPASAGWRVQYAYPQELWVISEENADLRQKLSGYGVPIHFIEKLEDVTGTSAPDPNKLVASGGLIAPVSPIYSVTTGTTGATNILISQNLTTGVTQAIPNFSTSSGGMTYALPKEKKPPTRLRKILRSPVTLALFVLGVPWSVFWFLPMFLLSCIALVLDENEVDDACWNFIFLPFNKAKKLHNRRI